MPPELPWQVGVRSHAVGSKGRRKMAPASACNAFRLPLFQHLQKFFKSTEFGAASAAMAIFD
jgi:hypothetical protein